MKLKEKTIKLRVREASGMPLEGEETKEFIIFALELEETIRPEFSLKVYEAFFLAKLESGEMNLNDLLRGFILLAIKNRVDRAVRLAEQHASEPATEQGTKIH